MMFAEEMLSKRFPLLLSLLTLCAVVLRMAMLADVPPNSDSITAAETAFDYMLNGTAGGTMWHHPKLRNIMLYFSLSAVGGSVWGLHLPSIVMGSLSVTLMGIVMRYLSGSTLAALFCAFLLAVDSVHIDFSRQAIQEVYMPFFTLLGIWLVLEYRDKGHRWCLTAAGCAFGLGMAGKWYVLFPTVVTLAYMLWILWRDCQQHKTDYREMANLFFSLTLLPLTIYALTFLPWMLHRGYGLAGLIELHRLMLQESLTHQGFNPLITGNDTQPLLWFIKPAGFADFVMNGERPVIFVAVTNPIVWLATLPALSVVAWEAFRTRNRDMLFLIALFAVSYAPLLRVNRPIWVHTALAVVPFAFMLIAQAAALLVRSTRRGSMLLAIYVALVLLTAAPLYLLAIGKGAHNLLLQPIVERYRPAFERQGGLRP